MCAAATAEAPVEETFTYQAEVCPASLWEASGRLALLQDVYTCASSRGVGLLE